MAVRSAKNYLWVFYLVFIFAAITFIVLALVFARPVIKTNQVIENNLQSNFNAGQGELIVTRNVVPFQISAPQLIVANNAGTFSSSQLGSAVLDSAGLKLIANNFQVHGGTMRVISLQIIADFVGDDEELGTSRKVGIYNLNTNKWVVSPRNISANDALDSGFYTLRLPENEPAVLIPFVNYAICSLVCGQVDRHFTDANTVQASGRVNLMGRLEFKSDTFPDMLPSVTNFTSMPNNLGFASFQLQLIETGPTVAFDVDFVNGFGRFPAEYLYNLNVSVQDETTIVIDPGVCIDNQNLCNMLNINSIVLKTTSVGTINGIDKGQMEANQWYAVFLIISSSQGLPSAGMFSKNRQEPDLLPKGYDIVRRVGWVRTATNDVFLLKTKQTGNGARRRTFFIDEQVGFEKSFSSTDVLNGVFYNFPLNLVAPLATSVKLLIRAKNPNQERASFQVRLPYKTDATNFGNFPNGTSHILTTLPIGSMPLPYFFDIALLGMFIFGTEAPIEISITIEAFYDKV